jgi:hypothetical protein
MTIKLPNALCWIPMDVWVSVRITGHNVVVVKTSVLPKAEIGSLVAWLWSSHADGFDTYPNAFDTSIQGIKDFQRMLMFSSKH